MLRKFLLIVKNLFNKSTVTIQKFVDCTNGTMANSGSGNNASDYIAVTPQTMCSLSGLTFVNAGNAGLAWFGANKTYISGVPYNGTGNGDYLSPANAAYIMFTVHNSDLNTTVFKRK